MQILQAAYEKIIQAPFLYPHSPNTYLFFLTKSAFSVRLSGETLDKQDGNLVFCKAETFGQISPLKGSGILDYLVFSVTAEEEKALNALPLPVNQVTEPPHFSELSAQMKVIENLFSSADKYRLEKSAHFLMILLYCIASGDEDLTDRTRSGVQYYRLRQLRRSLSDSPEQHPTVAEAAAYVGLCESRFSALYREYFGVSYISDLIRTRIRRSCAMLETTDWTIAKIAAELGYENESNFYRQFHQQIGISPREYRKMQEQSEKSF